VETVPIDSGCRDRVHTLVTAYLDGLPVPADLGAEPAAVRCGTAVVYLRLVDAEPPVVRVFSPLLRNLPTSPDLLAELNELNARLSFLRVFWRDNTVYAAAELLAETLTAVELANACDWIADAADYYDQKLHARFGGDLAFAPPADHPEAEH
jgi:hypothetical protein